MSRKNRSLESYHKQKMQYYNYRKSQIFSYLGNVCVVCGTTDELQVDHRDHETKNFTVMSNYSRAWDILVPELDKCQLLCKTHHLEKSMEEGSLKKGDRPAPSLHGTLNRYNAYGCRCDECKAAKSKSRKKTVGV